MRETAVYVLVPEMHSTQNPGPRLYAEWHSARQLWLVVAVLCGGVLVLLVPWGHVF